MLSFIKYEPNQVSPLLRPSGGFPSSLSTKDQVLAVTSEALQGQALTASLPFSPTALPSSCYSRHSTFSAVFNTPISLLPQIFAQKSPSQEALVITFSKMSATNPTFYILFPASFYLFAPHHPLAYSMSFLFIRSDSSVYLRDNF